MRVALSEWLDTKGDVDRVARRGVVAPSVHANVAEDGAASVKPDADAEGDVVEVLPHLASQRRGQAAERDGGLDRSESLGPQTARLGDPECHHGITDELVDPPIVLA